MLPLLGESAGRGAASGSIPAPIPDTRCPRGRSRDRVLVRFHFGCVLVCSRGSSRTRQWIEQNERRMTCLAVADYCICTLDGEHDGAHRCGCGGSWNVENGERVIVKFPGKAGERYGGDAVGALMGLLGIEDDE